MVLVDDVVARPQVGEALQRSPEACIGARRPLAEDLSVREQDQAELAPNEAPARRRDREQKLGFVRQRLAGLEQPCLDAPEQVLHPQCLAPMRKGDDHS